MKKKKQEKIEYTSEEEKREKHFQSLFPKEKEKKKRKKTARVDAAEVARFNADLDEGLSKIQVEQRQEQGLVNKTGKKYSKTYKSIFVGNICTFFNLLCFLAALLGKSAHGQDWDSDQESECHAPGNLRKVSRAALQAGKNRIDPRGEQNERGKGIAVKGLKAGVELALEYSLRLHCGISFPVCAVSFKNSSSSVSSVTASRCKQTPAVTNATDSASASSAPDAQSA